MDLTRQGYYYHPLGNLAKELIDNVNDRQFPYVIDGDDNTKPSGVGNIEFGTGPKIPGGVEVYAMATGAIYNITVDETGFSIYLRTTKQDISGEIICIKYSCLGGLSDDIANAIGAPTGIIKQEELKNLTLNSIISLQVTAGQMIGYSNNWDEQKMLKIGFVYRYTTDNEDTDASKFINDLPHLDTEKVKNENITFEAINDENSIAKYIVKCDDTIIGTNQGMCRLENGQSSAYYPVYPFISYMVLQQKPVYCQTSTPDGGMSLSPTVDVPSDDYLHTSFTDRYMGKYPSQLSDINSPECQAIKTLALAAKGEFGENEEGLSYGKLFRAWILHYNPIRGYIPNGVTVRENNSTLAGFARYWSNIVYNGWGGSNWLNAPYWEMQASNTEDFLIFMQNLYKNIAYPNIYGITKDYCIEACSNMPYANETTSLGSNIPVTNGSPLVFSVIERYSGGWYVLFRTEAMTNSFMSPNPAVKQ